MAEAVNGAFSYVGSDGLGSAEVALDGSGNAQASTLYSPYGNTRYSTGTMPGSYGFTGQRADAATGLDYDTARYYDPVAGQFTTPDSVQDGLNRYAYVAGNPETRTDPSGHNWFGSLLSTVSHVAHAVAPAAVAVLDATTGIPSMINDVHTIFFSNASAMDKLMAGGDLLLNLTMDVTSVIGVGEGLRVAYVGAHIAEHVAEDVAAHVVEHVAEDTAEHAAEHVAEDAAEHASEDGAEALCKLSFAPNTPVATPEGEQAIASLKVGDKVTAYDPSTGKPTTQTVQHVWINHDTDLVDLTLQTQVAVPAGKGQDAVRYRAQDEVVHTTAKHPFLTKEAGFLPVAQLSIGMHVVREDGTLALVVGEQVVPGAADMWNLTVSNVHTYAVGAGEYVVHNCNQELPASETWNSKRPETLQRHFEEHGADFGATSAEDYADKASDFLQRSQAEGKPTAITNDGSMMVYDPETNTFGAYNADGTTQTFYKPKEDYPYWFKQLDRFGSHAPILLDR